MTIRTHGFSPVHHRRAFEEIVRQVEDALLEGRLSVGDRLPPERQLAEIFGVSRPAVREAMRVLEAFGLIVTRRGTGATSGAIITAGDTSSGFGGLLRLYAATMDIPLADLTEVRLALEIAAVRAAVARATSKDFDKLSEVVWRMKDALSADALLQADTDFHLLIAELSGNSALALLMAELRDAIATQMLSGFETLERLGKFESERRRLVRQHERIARLIQSRDAAGAIEALRKHITGFYGRVLNCPPDTLKTSASARKRDAQIPVGRQSSA